LWNDLYNLFETEKQNNNKPNKSHCFPACSDESIDDQVYSLGSVFLSIPNLHTDEAFKLTLPNASDRPYCIVDGQQRLITISLLLRALWHDDLQQYVEFIRCFQRCNKYNFNESLGSRFLFSNLDLRYDLDETLQTVKEPELTHTLYYKNYSYFKNKIDSLFDKLENRKKFINTILHKTYFSKNIYPNEIRAMTFFETPKHKGLVQTDGDKLKIKLAKLALEGSMTTFASFDNFSSAWWLLESKIDALRNASNRKITLNKLFQRYMIALRKKHNDTTPLVKIKDFFEGNVKDTQNNKRKTNKYTFEKIGWSNVITSLEQIINEMTSQSQQQK
jgi:hypothetical protein